MLDHPYRRKLVVLNLIGGTLVLASYLWGAFWAPETMGSLWGGVPESIRPLYTVNMLAAAAGYFLFAPHILLRLDPEARYLNGRGTYHFFLTCFAAILFPSAFWLPLTALMLTSPSLLLWWLIRVDLLFVGLGSLGLLAAVWFGPSAGHGASGPRAQSPDTGQIPRRAHALLGLAPFCLQTALLDALIWPIYFPH